MAAGQTESKGRRWAKALVAIGALAVVAVATSAVAVAMPEPTTRFVATTGSDSGNDCLEATSPCATVQHGVAEADPGDAVSLAAGTYEENVTIGKPLDLVGPNAGVDPNSGSRGPEAVIDGGAAIAVAPGAAEITIDGLTIAGDDGGHPVYAHTGAVDGLRIVNDIVGTGVRAVAIASPGEGVEIEHSRIHGKGYGIAFGLAAYPDLRIADNVVDGPVDYYGIFSSGGAAEFHRFEMVGNRMHAAANIGGTVRNGVVRGNSFDAFPSEEVALQIDLHQSGVIDNSFDGQGTNPCLQLFGSQYELDPSEGVLVRGNRFEHCDPYAVQLSPDIDQVAITGNRILDSYDGVSTRDLTAWDLSGKSITVAANRIVGSTHLGVGNTVDGTLDARDNWWGCNAGPGAPGCDGSGGSVRTSPNAVFGAVAAPARVLPGGEAAVSASLNRDSAGLPVPGVPGGTVAFGATTGTIDPAGAELVDGSAAAGFKAGSALGPAGVTATLDHQSVPVALSVFAPGRPPVTLLPPPAARPRPRAQERAEHLRVVGFRFGVGSLSCGPSACRVGERHAWVKFGGKKFRLRVHVRGRIPAGRSAWVRVTLPRPARRALRRGRAGLVQVRVKLRDSSGNAYGRKIRLKVRSRSPRG